VPLPTTQSSPPFVWVEIGRASPDGGAPWTVWMALLSEDGALYRTLVVADGSATVAVGLQPPHSTVMRTVHRDRCRLSPDAEDGDDPIRLLLSNVDEAVRAALTPPAVKGSRRPEAAAPAQSAAGDQPATARPPPAADDRRSSPPLRGP
jgi:hypothetical protein